MTYEESIQYLYDQLPMFTRIGAAAYKKDIHNTVALCAALNNPERSFKSIHIAGTNGKGSTSHMLAAILQEAGYKTGLYTSPHIRDFGERIRINGAMIDQDFVVNFVEKTKQLCTDIQPSFFELTVAMAFTYFAEQGVDIAVIETGLGGRLDSTNIITPVLSVITNIGFDHMQLLGSTLPEIAFEKAGIIKQGIPVVIGETLPETLPVFEEKAAEMKAPLHLAEKRFAVTGSNIRDQFLACVVHDLVNDTNQKFLLDLNGLYQSRNICTVLTSVSILRKMGFHISDEQLHIALQQVKKTTGLRGRWDIVSNHPTVIFDVAHNEDGIRQLLHQLSIQYPSATVHFVLGFVQDKDVSKVLSLLPRDGKYYFTNAHIPRAMSHQMLQEKAVEYHLNGKSYDQADEALEAAQSEAGWDDVVMVCGSFFVIAELTTMKSV
jgi:dihydrofolate synthase/folylpolyglutamate synthase